MPGSSDRGHALVDAVARRVAHRRGVRAVKAGALPDPDWGHPAGTEYVVIEARTLLDCEHAETNLAAIGRVPDMAWEHGWQDGTTATDWPFQLRIFPQVPQV
jgi:hypothetical protein